MRTSLTGLLQQHGLQVDWDIPEHQPLTLHILFSISHLVHDPDKDLFYNLINGVPTGFKQDIPFLTVLHKSSLTLMPCMNLDRCICPVGDQLMMTRRSLKN